MGRTPKASLSRVDGGGQCAIEVLLGGTQDSRSPGWLQNVCEEKLDFFQDFWSIGSEKDDFFKAYGYEVGTKVFLLRY